MAGLLGSNTLVGERYIYDDDLNSFIKKYEAAVSSSGTKTIEAAPEKEAIPDALETATVLPAQQVNISQFKAWYLENFFIISLIQWAIIILIVLRISRQN